MGMRDNHSPARHSRQSERLNLPSWKLALIIRRVDGGPNWRVAH
jgi:hypothetical protein